MRSARVSRVFLTNSAAIYSLYLGTPNITSLNRLLEQAAKNQAEWLHFAVLTSVPLVGIFLEALDSRFAKYLNIGHWHFYGSYFSLIFVWNRSDYHAAPLLLLAPVALAIAAVNFFLYRRRRSQRCDLSS